MAEQLVYAFLKKKLDWEDLKDIYTQYQLENEVDEETRDEILSYLWSQIRWGYLLQKLRDEKMEDKSDDETNVSDRPSEDEDCWGQGGYCYGKTKA